MSDLEFVSIVITSVILLYAFMPSVTLLLLSSVAMRSVIVLSAMAPTNAINSMDD